jgi:hypothetical protein
MSNSSSSSPQPFRGIRDRHGDVSERRHCSGYGAASQRLGEPDYRIRQCGNGFGDSELWRRSEQPGKRIRACRSHRGIARFFRRGIALLCHHHAGAVGDLHSYGYTCRWVQLRRDDRFTAQANCLQALSILLSLLAARSLRWHLRLRCQPTHDRVRWRWRSDSPNEPWNPGRNVDDHHHSQYKRQHFLPKRQCAVDRSVALRTSPQNASPLGSCAISRSDAEHRPRGRLSTDQK